MNFMFIKWIVDGISCLMKYIRRNTEEIIVFGTLGAIAYIVVVTSLMYFNKSRDEKDYETTVVKFLQLSKEYEGIRNESDCDALYDPDNVNELFKTNK